MKKVLIILFLLFNVCLLAQGGVERPATNNGANKAGDKDTVGLKYGVYEILDHNDYPETINVTIGGQEFTMVLVRGGYFNMGYNGRGSSRMHSEPIHRVNLSSFYMSKQYLSETAIVNILEGTNKKGSYRPESITRWIKINKILEKIGDFRFPTEAEWEYAALTPISKIIFSDNDDYEWCSDYFDDYPSQEQTNPKGGKYGDEHVIRAFDDDNDVWKRYENNGDDYDPYIRLAIDPDKLINQIQKKQ